MNDIYKLYHNDFGIAFKWKDGHLKDTKKIQLIFRNAGLSITKRQLNQLLECTYDILENTDLCDDCKSNDSCKAILLETPTPMISFAMSYIEIKNMKDLLKGTLFQIEMDTLLKKNKMN